MDSLKVSNLVPFILVVLMSKWFEFHMEFATSFIYKFPFRVFSQNSYLTISVCYTEIRILYQSCDLQSPCVFHCLLAITANLF